MAAGWQFWIDRGGTFTDIVALDPDGKVAVRKLLSENPEQYPDAALHGIGRILQEFGAGGKVGIAAVKMGTTVGTNALLERKGAPVALVTNRGLRDCLYIGYQNRPDIFALQIRRPEPLYRAVAEIDVRVGADGRVVQALDPDQANAELRRIYDLGIRNLAIVLMHAWRYPQHELALAELAAGIGFEHISLSHRASPLPKFVARGDTAVVDAYLSPVLHRYVAQVENGLPAGASRPGLWFMQSNGGLVRAAVFHGKDSILSGPAGGMVGAVAAAKRAGLARSSLSIWAVPLPMLPLRRRTGAQLDNEIAASASARRWWRFIPSPPAAALFCISTVCAAGSGRTRPGPIPVRPVTGAAGR